MYVLDQLDRKIIAATETGLPLEARPYRVIAERVGSDEATIMQRLQTMLAAGAIRRIGVIPNHYQLGYVANGMSVWDVADAVVERCGAAVGALPFVSHCYQRPRRPPLWQYNLFAMVHGKSRDEVAAKVATIAALLGEDQRGHQVLYSSKILKKAGFRSSTKIA